ncbi:MAG: thermonuclease family protein [Candidatus Nealsonbacteria bacterium]
MKNKIKLISIVIGAAVLVSVGFGLGRRSMSSEITELKDRVASLEEQIKVQNQLGEKVEEKKKIGPTGPTRLATVNYVIDGDTIEVDEEERVRYLGINTPESGRPYFSEATNENKKLVDGKEIKLELDVQTKDKYNRTLAYVWIGETMVNLELVRRGFANVYTFPPNVKYKEQFLEAEREARENCRGLWYPCKIAGAENGIKIVNINADAPGNDNENKNGEWLEIRNQEENSVSMTNWTIKDEANHIYTFADFILAPDKSVFIYSGCDIDTQEKLYWQCPEGEYAIWNNSGDTAFLRDASGNLVDSYKY